MGLFHVQKKAIVAVELLHQDFAFEAVLACKVYLGSREVVILRSLYMMESSLLSVFM